MNEYDIQSDHPRILSYFNEIKKIGEIPVAQAKAQDLFARLIKYFAGQVGWVSAEKIPVYGARQVVSVDGVFLDSLNLIQGIWIHLPLDCDRKIRMKEEINKGIPVNNLLFHQNDRLILWRRGKKMIDMRFTTPEDAASVLTTFFRSPFRTYTELKALEERAKLEGALVARNWLESVKKESITNDPYKQSINNLRQNFQTLDNSGQSFESVWSMIVKYLLIRRFCDKIFGRSSDITSSLISMEIEKVLVLAPALRITPDLIKEIETPLRQVASQLRSNNEKLLLLESILAKFFPRTQKRITEIYDRRMSHEVQSVLFAEILNFILTKEFDQKIGDKDINILDPFCHDGTYLRQILLRLNQKRLDRKYQSELFGNETDIISYFLSLINIENTYIELSRHFQPFCGLNLIDTFSLTDEKDLSLYNDENSQQLDKLKHVPFNIIVGDVPYSIRKVSSRSSRGSSVIDKRVQMTYGRASRARNKSVLADSYVKAIRWASDAIIRKKEGIVCLACKNNFIGDLAFDGFRQHLTRDFDTVFVLDIGSDENSKHFHHFKTNKALLILIKRKGLSQTGIHYCRTGWNDLINESCKPEFDLYRCFNWRKIEPDKHHTWMTEGLQQDFETYLPLGTKISRAGRGNAVFHMYGRGLATSRDAWIYNFNRDYLVSNIQDLIRIYNKHVQTWLEMPSKPQIDSYLSNSDEDIPWSESLKNYLKRQIKLRFRSTALREAIYRPFVKKYVYFDQYLVERWYQLPHMLPMERNENENRLICLSSPGSKHFSCLMTNRIPDLNLFAGASPIQCFPLFHYDKDGKNRTQNVTNWALEKFVSFYRDDGITKYDLFHYIYAVLHHPTYLRKYAANLKKELPRIPLIKSYYNMVDAGKNLARIHLYYMGQEEYPVKISSPFGSQPDWHVERIMITEDRSSIILNDSLAVSNIPSESFDYMIGNRSALEWMLDQYRIKLPFSNGQYDDPNKNEDPSGILRLIGQLITVGLKSVKLIEGMPVWEEIG